MTLSFFGMSDSPLENGSTVIMIRMIGGLDEDEIETNVEERESESIVCTGLGKDYIANMDRDVLLRESTCNCVSTNA